MPRLKTPARTVQMDLEGTAITAREGESLATAMLAAGETVFSRSLKYHRPRGPFCMNGGCSHCLMRVDGVPNVYTCRTLVKAGMRVERQNAFPSAKHDVFGALDWFFPKGIDHHEMFAGVPVAEKVMARVARNLAGLGLLPDKPSEPRPPLQTLRVKVVVAGAGPAGLGAARELASAGVDFLVLERDLSPGGRLVDGVPGEDDPPLGPLASAAHGHLKLRTLIIGMYLDAEGRYLAAVTFPPSGPQLLKVYADRFLLTNGGHASTWPFANNDVPGVMAERAISHLIRRDDFVPGTKFALVGLRPHITGLARLLASVGAKVVAEVAVDEGDEPLTAHGRKQVKGLSFQRGGKKQKVDCDAVAICLPPSPAFELARQGGANVIFDPVRHTFMVEADGDGRTASRDVFVAGDLLGEVTAAQAVASGARAAQAVAAEVAP